MLKSTLRVRCNESDSLIIHLNAALDTVLRVNDGAQGMNQQEACLKLCDQIDKAMGGGKLDLAFELAVRLRIGVAEVDMTNPNAKGGYTKAADALVRQLYSGNLRTAEAVLLILQVTLAPDDVPGQTFIDSPPDQIGSA
jgi:hypothetical protein